MQPESIINALSRGMQNMPQVHAGWVEGSRAAGTDDEFSDIDIWFDIDDDAESVVFEAVRQTLGSLGDIDVEFDQPNNHPDLSGRVYHLQGTPPTLQIDINLQKHHRKYVFRKNMVGEEIAALFDKDGTLAFSELNHQELRTENLKQLEGLEQRFYGMRPAIERQLHRGRFLEALLYYHRWALEPLVEVLRIAYQPTKVGFSLKHIYRDLPTDVTSQLESFFAVSTTEEMRAHLKGIDTLFTDAARIARNK